MAHTFSSFLFLIIVIPADLCSAEESLFLGLYDAAFAEAEIYAYASDNTVEQTGCFDYSRFTQAPFTEGGSTYVLCGEGFCNEIEINSFGSANHVVIRVEVFFGSAPGVQLRCGPPP